MLQQGRPVHVVILAAVCKNSANLRARQRLIIAVLPSHGERRQVPVVAAGDSGAAGIGFLMAGRAIEPGYAFAFRASDHVGKVTPPIVTLLRITRSGVAVDTAWMGQD